MLYYLAIEHFNNVFKETFMSNNFLSFSALALVTMLSMACGGGGGGSSSKGAPATSNVTESAVLYSAYPNDEVVNELSADWSSQSDTVGNLTFKPTAAQQALMDESGSNKYAVWLSYNAPNTYESPETLMTAISDQFSKTLSVDTTVSAGFSLDADFNVTELPSLLETIRNGIADGSFAHDGGVVSLTVYGAPAIEEDGRNTFRNPNVLGTLRVDSISNTTSFEKASTIPGMGDKMNITIPAGDTFMQFQSSFVGSANYSTFDVVTMGGEAPAEFVDNIGQPYFIGKSGKVVIVRYDDDGSIDLCYLGQAKTEDEDNRFKATTSIFPHLMEMVLEAEEALNEKETAN